MTFLLDVNVLIALVDPSHVGHDIAPPLVCAGYRHLSPKAVRGGKAALVVIQEL